MFKFWKKKNAKTPGPLPVGNVPRPVARPTVPAVKKRREGIDVVSTPIIDTRVPEGVINSQGWLETPDYVPYADGFADTFSGGGGGGSGFDGGGAGGSWDSSVGSDSSGSSSSDSSSDW